YFFFQAEDGIRDRNVTEFRRVLFRSPKNRDDRISAQMGVYNTTDLLPLAFSQTHEYIPTISLRLPTILSFNPWLGPIASNPIEIPTYRLMNHLGGIDPVTVRTSNTKGTQSSNDKL